MRFQCACATLLGGVASFAAAAPSSSRSEKRSPLIIQQIVPETNIIVVENQNLGEIDALTSLAEEQFAQLVKDQVELATQLQTIKDNVRLNHFRARFSAVNTVIVSVTTLVDGRVDAASNATAGTTRYMVNQLLADNSATSSVTVMVSDAATMTLGVGATAVAAFGGSVTASAVGTATAAPVIQAASNSTPFGEIGQNVILAAGVAAPSVDLVFEDPAAIILADQTNLFVESTDTFLQDCSFYQANADAFLDLASQSFTSFETISAAGGTVTIVKQGSTEVVEVV
ncbi:hypothetical protein GGR56DRAFT_688778 [Xylariaceae sp. FL0804]|nr:hypothetical protein GGR56DRAFT_688778 [Xylariaceae sp. FL0804]